MLHVVVALCKYLKSIQTEIDTMNRLVLTALAMAVALPALADSQVSNSDYRCGTRNPYYARTDGLCVDTDEKATVAIGNGDMVMGLNRYLIVDLFEDFQGNTDVPGTGDTIVNQSTPWYVDDQSASGSPTFAEIADADNGQYQLTLAATNEAENLTFYFKDQQTIDSDSGPVMVVRAYVNTLPSAADEIIVMGFGSAQNDDEDAIASNAWFKLDANASLLVESDDTTTNDDDNDTSFDVVVDTWYEFMIDCSTVTDCDFFYRSTLAGDWTEVLAATAFSLGADASVQPYIQIQKATGTGVPSLYLDFVHVWWKRGDA